VLKGGVGPDKAELQSPNFLTFKLGFSPAIGILEKNRLSSWFSVPRKGTLAM
jgi:hypothetical protein